MQDSEGAARLDYNGKMARIRDYAFDRDGKRALTGADDATVRLWDVETGTCLHVLEGLTADVRAVAWSTDQRHVVAGDAGGEIRAWDFSGLDGGGVSIA
jgi:WD40 repeat protein